MDGLIDHNDLVHLIQSTDKFLIEDLIGRMNVEQLLIARDTIGEHAFKALLADRKEQHFRLLGSILSLRPEMELVRLKLLLNNYHIFTIAKNFPLIARIIRDQLISVEDAEIQTILEKIYCPPEWSDKQDSTHNVTIKIHDQTYLIDKSLASKYSTTFKHMYSDLEATEEIADFSIHFVDANACTIGLFIDLINERPIRTDKQKLLDLIPLCDRMDFEPKIIEYYLLAHISDFDDDELSYIVSTHTGLDRLSAILEKRLLNKKIHAEDWCYKWSLARDLQFINLKTECLKYAYQQVWDILTGPKPALDNAEFWLNVCRQIIDENTYIDYFKYFADKIASRLNYENLPNIYTFANKFCLMALKNVCLKFCSNNAEALKQNLPWKSNDIPHEIDAILYPKGCS